MKQKLLTFLAFICLTSSVFSQNFDVSFSGSSVNISLGTSEFNPNNTLLESQIIGDKLYTASELYDEANYGNKYIFTHDDFTNTSPNFDINGLNYSQYVNTSCVDEIGNMYVALDFYTRTEVYGQTFVEGIPNNLSHLILKYDNLGNYISAIQYEATYNVTAMAARHDSIYVAYDMDDSGTIGLIDFQNPSAPIDITVVPNSNIRKIILDGSNIYTLNSMFAGATLNFGPITFLPLLDNYSYYFIAKYSIFDAFNLIETNAYVISNGENLTTADDFIVDADGSLYITGTFRYVFANQFTSLNSGYYSHFIVKFADYGMQEWAQVFENDVYTQTKILNVNNSLYVTGTTDAWDGDGSFYPSFGDFTFSTIDLNHNSTYVLQLDKASGTVYDAECFYSEMSDVKLIDIGYNSVTDSVSVYLSTYNSDVTTSKLINYTNQGNNFIKATFKHNPIKLKVFNPYDELFSVYFNCRGDGFAEVSIDVAAITFLNTLDAADIIYSIDAPSNITTDLTDNVLTIPNYEKVGRGIDTVKIIATSISTSETAIGYLFLYELDPFVPTWDSSAAKQCYADFPNTNNGVPLFGNLNDEKPAIIDRFIYSASVNFMQAHTLSKDGLSYQFDTDTNPSGIYEFNYLYTADYVVRNWQYELYCVDSVSYDQYEINTPPTITLQIPDTVCSTVLFSDYVDLQGGTFYQEYNFGEGQTPMASGSPLYESQYSGYNSYYEYLMTGGLFIISYELYDEATACTVLEIDSTVFVRDAQSLNSEISTYYQYCTNQSIEPIEFIDLLNDSVTWFNDYHLTDSVAYGLSCTPIFDSVGSKTLFASQIIDGCRTMPLEFDLNLYQAPEISIIADTILCVGEVNTLVMLENDLNISSQNIYKYWYESLDNGITYDQQLSSFDNMNKVFLDEGYFQLQEFTTDGCSENKSIQIISKIVAEPVISDVSVVYGNPVPTLSVLGNNIRWYSDNGSLIHEGNDLQTSQTAIGDYSYSVSETDGRCESAKVPVTLSINPCSAVAPVFVQDTISYCINLNDYVLDANDSSVRWFKDKNKVSPVTGNDSLVFTDLLPGYYSYYAADYDSTEMCFGPTTKIVLDIEPKPVVFVNIPDISNEKTIVDLMPYASPQGGVYSGLDISEDSLFSVTTAGVGEHTVSYLFTDNEGCYETVSETFNVIMGSVPVSKITALDTVKITLNQTVQLEALYTPSNATYKTVNWTSNNDAIASVTSTGLVTANSVDTTSILIEWTEDNVINTSVVLVVLAPQNATFAPLADICFNAEAIMLTGGLPLGGKYFGQGVSQSYFNPEGLAEGTYTLGYAYVDAFGNKDTAYSDITVNETIVPIVTNVEVEDDKPIPTLEASGLTLTWYASLALQNVVNTGTVFDHGKTTAGVYTYYVTSLNEVTNCVSDPVSITLSIIPSDTIVATSVKASIDTIKLHIQESVKVQASLLPANTTVQTVSWIVTNDLIASISQAGIITGLISDTTEAIVQWSEDQTIADTIVVIVMPNIDVSFAPLADICFNAESIMLTGGLPLGGKYFGQGVSQSYFNPEGLAEGTYTLGYTYVDAFGNKDTAYSDITVIEPSLPVVYAVSEKESELVSPLSATGDSIVWYQTIYLTDTLATGNIYEHGKTEPGVYTYYTVNVLSGCTSNSVPVTLTIEPCILSQPKISAKSLVQCENDEPIAFVAEATNEVYWYDNEFNEISSGPEFTPNTLEFGSKGYVAMQFDGSCYSAPVYLYYTYAQTPQVEITIPDSVVIDKGFTASALITNTSTYISKWFVGSKIYTANDVDLIYSTEQTVELSHFVVNTQTGCLATKDTSVVIYKKHIPVESISILKDTISIFTNHSYKPSLSVLPAYATDKTVRWISSNSDIAQVLQSEIYAITAGETWVYAISNDNGIQDSIFVRVNEFYPVTAVSLPQRINVTVDDTLYVTASVLPAYASIPDVKFIAKEDSIISISSTGKLIAKKAGMSTITVFSVDGSQYATSIIFVADQPIDPTELNLDETIHAIKGTQKSISLFLLPEFSSTTNLVWYSAEESIATVSAPGLLHAIEVGQTTIFVKDTVTNVTTSAIVRVTNSLAPEFYPLPNLHVNQIGDSIVINLAHFASDDSTSLTNLTWIAEESEYVSIEINGSIATIKPKQGTFVGIDTLHFSVFDEEMSQAVSSMILSIEEKVNEAPVVSSQEFLIQFSQSYNEFDLSTRATDDFSASSELIWEFAAHERFSFTQEGSYVLIQSLDPQWYGVDSIDVTVTDRNGASTAAQIAIQVIDKPNEAPVIVTIPVQYNNDSVFFSYIELNDFVSDDYTSPSDIKWSCTSSNVLFVKFVQNIALLKITNPFWSGAEKLTFTAMDQHGAKTNIDVLFVQEQSRGDGWEGKPLIDFVADREFAVPGDKITLYGSLSGAKSWKWTVEGVELDDSSKVIQEIMFAEPGTYNVSLWAINTEDIEVLVKEDYLTIYGVTNREPAICIGDQVTLSVNNPNLQGYLWSTGETTSSITVAPSKTKEYTVAISDGLFSFVDRVNVRVSVPVDLGKDSSICEYSQYELHAGNYDVFDWSTGSTTESIIISDAGKYTVTTTDDLGCVSTDSFTVPSLHKLPDLYLGEDVTLCDGEVLFLDAGLGYTYEWNNGSRAQQVFVDTTSIVSVAITDKNQCVSKDTINITFRYPFTEQLGVVTFSQTTNNIIIAWEKTLGVNTMKYQVYRETNIANTWSLVQEVNFDEHALVVDSMANYVMKQYRYALVTVDSCGNKSGYSIPHRSMHLQTSWNTDADKKMQLHWTLYEPKEAVETYLILRGEPGDSLVAVDSLGHDAIQWTDPISNQSSLYRVAFRLKKEVNDTVYNILKAESGPFSLAVSNIAEAEANTAINSIGFDADVVVYPLPITDVINVAIISDQAKKFSVDLLNVQGQVIESQQEFVSGKSVIQFSAAQLSYGVYTIKVSDGTATKLIKVVK